MSIESNKNVSNSTTNIVISNTEVNVTRILQQGDSASSVKFQMIMTTFLLAYTLLGALVFQILERPAEEERIREYQEKLHEGRLQLMNIIVQINNNQDSDAQVKGSSLNATIQALVNYESKIDEVFGTKLSIQELLNNAKLNWQWGNYLHVYFFVLTLISTIGYGNLAPKTPLGRIFCIGYAVVGIPVFLIFIAQAGKILARFSVSLLVKAFGGKIRKAYFASENSRNRRMVGTSISLSGVIIFVFVYMSIGAVIIYSNEPWGYIDSFYFCFITLTTVGFGDILPSEGKQSSTPYLVLFMRTIYTVFGLAITSTAIALLQKHYAETWTRAVKGVESERANILEVGMKVLETSKSTSSQFKIRKCGLATTDFLAKPAI